MQKTILSAIFLVVAGVFMREYGASPFWWNIGGIAGWIGIVLGFISIAVWVEPHIRKSLENFFKAEDKDDK